MGGVVCILSIYISPKGRTAPHWGKRVTVNTMPAKPPPIKKSLAKKAGAKTPEPAPKPEPVAVEVPPPAEPTPVEPAPAAAPPEEAPAPTSEGEVVPAAAEADTPAAEGKAPGRWISPERRRTNCRDKPCYSPCLANLARFRGIQVGFIVVSLSLLLWHSFFALRNTQNFIVFSPLAVLKVNWVRSFKILIILTHEREGSLHATACHLIRSVCLVRPCAACQWWKDVLMELSDFIVSVCLH